MVVYVEVAFLENFLIDTALLWLALLAAKRKISLGRITLSACLGALFALLFPLYTYPYGMEYALKFAVGLLLPYIAICEKGVGRYAITAGLFLIFSFGFAGAVIAFSGFFELKKTRVSIGAIVAVGCMFVLGTSCLIKRLYKKRLLHIFTYSCRIRVGEKEISANGFLDSGNRLSVKGKPVGFITPDIAYELIGAEWIREETTVLTVAGIKKIKIFQANFIEIYYEKTTHRIENIYLSPSTQILGREYKILLGAWAIE